METSVKAAEVLAPPQPDVASSEGAEGEATAPPPAACSSSSDFFNPMEEFSRRLEDIISTYGSAASVLDKQQSQAEAETEKRKETKEDVAVAMETEVSHIKQSLNKLCSPEDKLEALVRKYAELSALRRCDEKKLCVLQQRLSVLQADGRSSVAARSKLETLCRELQGHYCQLREETLQRCKEEEEKKTEMANHFQTMLTEIQAQIEQHSARNDKLCHENTNLTDKLESLMNQYELREQSLEKINKHRDLQHKLTEAKLQQANALLSEAEEKHKREKEYLLREAIDKTKKCFAMKEQELAMKKKLTLYAQKFDEFQETLAKSNQIYTRFKKEMENMSEKMKKMDKESNLWKTRFENCNKALTDMMEERLEKSKEYDLFVLKIQKLEKLCRALQDERVILYEKIKEVRHTNSNISSKVFSSSNLPDPEGAETSALLSPEELQEIQDEDPVLTKDMSRLREEQAKLQQFAASLLATPLADDEEKNDDVDREEDLMASAFVHFKTKTQVKTEQVGEDRPEAAEPVCPQAGEEAPDVSSPEAPTPDMKPADTKPEGEQVQTQVENREEQPAEPANEIQQQPAEPTPEPEEAKTEAPADPEPEPEPAPAELPVQAAEDKPVNPVETEKVQTEPAQEEAPTKSESTPPTRVSSSEDTPKTSAEDTPKTSAEDTPKTSAEDTPKTSAEDTPKTSAEDTPKTSAASNGDSSKKHTPKKKKKRNNKNAS